MTLFVFLLHSSFLLEIIPYLVSRPLDSLLLPLLLSEQSHFSSQYQYQFQSLSSRRVERFLWCKVRELESLDRSVDASLFQSYDSWLHRREEELSETTRREEEEQERETDRDSHRISSNDSESTAQISSATCPTKTV